MRTILSRIGDVWIAVATALAIVALTIPLFLNPVWVGFEQGRAQATAWTGFTETQLSAATNAILGDLVIGPPEFDAALEGTPVLDERERAHMRDVRGVFAGFYAVAIVGAIIFLVLRDLKDVLLVLVPIALASAATAALTVAVGMPFNYANIIALPLLVGMGVDNGIHVVHRMRSESVGRGP